jgi:NAD(P)-dependent dehydrogenase (short-subunit alcohol dehydrogenase family)
MGSRVAVVTGGGRGIGRGIVLELGRLGLDLVVNYRSDRDSAEATCLEAQQLGSPRAIPLAADVADVGQGRSLVDRCLEAFGQIDVWVSNAGVAPEVRGDLLDLTEASWDRVLNTNLRGPFFAAQAAARAMLAGLEAGQVSDPQIHFITSASSAFASVNRGEYCVSKAGLSMVAQLFAARLAERGIRVFEIRPGIIATDMTAPVRAAYDRRLSEGLAPLRRWGEPAEVGRAVAGIVAGFLPYATGNVVEVDGGLHLRIL